MEKEKVKELVAKYNAGLTDPFEVTELEQLIEQGVVSLTDLHDLTQLEEAVANVQSAAPSLELDHKFYAMMREEKRKSKKFTLNLTWPQLNALMPRLAFGVALLVAGFLGGYFLNSPTQKTEVATLTEEVTNLKEMVMLSLLEKESATDRLKAVSLTSEMDQASRKVTQALIQTLNQDGNVNVRLAALDALRPYTNDSEVRAALIRSIGKQSSPLVQVALSELMVELQEKKSVGELKKLLESETTPGDVKKRIEENIEVLI